jgi:hypothetical protein
VSGGLPAPPARTRLERIAFTRDFETETLRLNAMLPCSVSAGKGKWEPVTVPGTVDGAKSSRYWYRRSFEVPPTMAAKRLKLRFEAVNHQAVDEPLPRLSRFIPRLRVRAEGPDTAADSGQRGETG